MTVTNNHSIFVGAPGEVGYKRARCRCNEGEDAQTLITERWGGQLNGRLAICGRCLRAYRCDIWVSAAARPTQGLLANVRKHCLNFSRGVDSLQQGLGVVCVPSVYLWVVNCYPRSKARMVHHTGTMLFKCTSQSTPMSIYIFMIHVIIMCVKHS